MSDERSPVSAREKIDVAGVVTRAVVLLVAAFAVGVAVGFVLARMAA